MDTSAADFFFTFLQFTLDDLIKKRQSERVKTKTRETLSDIVVDLLWLASAILPVALAIIILLSLH